MCAPSANTGSIERQRSNRLILEGVSQIVIMPKSDKKVKWTTKLSLLETLELLILNKLSSSYYDK